MNKPRYKKPTRRSRYYVDPVLWQRAIWFCRDYPRWIEQLAACSDSNKTVTDYANQVHVQTSGDHNPTEVLGIRRAELQSKVDIVNNAVNSVTDSARLQMYLKLGVTQHISYETLRDKHIPCGRRQYHQYRQEIIYRVAQAID